jgi:hypothetical protein
MTADPTTPRLRSRAWLDNPANIDDKYQRIAQPRACPRDDH